MRVSGVDGKLRWLGDVVERRNVELGALLAGVLSFALYVLTMSRGLTWRNLGADGGDLLTAAFTWGIPHPSGYPTYLLGLRAFSGLVPFGDEAFVGSLFSAALGGAAIVFVFLATYRLTGLVESTRHLTIFARWLSAFVAALAVGASRELWSQATITEVYALNGLIVAALLFGVITMYGDQLEGRERPKLRIGLALLLGLGLGNHLTLAMLALPLVVWSYTWHPDREDRVRLLRDWRVPVMFIAGLSVYLYAPLASSASPLLNWGHPENANGFWWMLSGSIYQQYQFGIEDSQILVRFTDLADLTMAQFAFGGVVLAIAGASFLFEMSRGFVIASAVSSVLVIIYAVGYDTLDSFLYLIPVFVLIGVFGGVGLAGLFSTVQRVAAVRGLMKWPRWRDGLIAVAVLAAIPGFSIFANYDDLNLSDDREAQEFVKSVFLTAGPGSVILANGSGPIFSLWYQSYVGDPDADVLIISVPHLQFDWYWDDMRSQAPDRIPENRPERFFDRNTAIIDYNLGSRAVWVAGETKLYESSYELEERGPIHRLLP
ncbi:MAG: DUF2723 domain-containing protein [Chloroflexi bacterium]|nr:DUF2723 domain-containing protein [Chloroflexota bacterium]